MDEVLEAIRKFIRSKRIILLDRVEFEKYKQKEGEDFESFYISTQQLAFDADLVNTHCGEFAKKCFWVKGCKQDHGWYNGCICPNEAVKDQGRGF